MSPAGTLGALAPAIAALAVLAMAPPAPAAAGTARGDMTGVWSGWEDQTPPQYRGGRYPVPPPLTAAGLEKSKYYTSPHNNLGARCLPAGGPAGMMNPNSFFPMEIIQKDKQVTIVFELMQQIRRIFLDGRPHPADLDPSWMGHSIGHWEGATLVVDTVGVHEGVLNGAGAAVIAQSTDNEWRMPYSEGLHLKERLTLLEGGKVLRDEMIVEDPKYYTHPMNFTRYWRRASELNMMEYVCTENERPRDEGTDPH